MIRLILSFLSGLVFTGSIAQEYASSSIFAHNDYVHPIPFYTAYYQQVGFIEADVFLDRGELLVAHTLQELERQKTLEALYLEPLQKQILKHEGYIYADRKKTLMLMVDLKTEGVSTLDLLVKKLKRYPQLLSCNTLRITVSGNVPAPAQWVNYPAFIHFDGRPGIAYTPDQLRRISMISTDFRKYAQWNGKGILTKPEYEKVVSLRDAVHAQGKKIRFWAAPDFPNAWTRLMALKIDILGTDNVIGLATFLKNKSKNTFLNDAPPHPVYQPMYTGAAKASMPRNIIFMIGDGMGLAQLYSGYTANRGALNIFTIKDIGFSVTTASDSYITDSAAGATAMATGKKTNNRHIGVDSLGNALASLTGQLKQQGFNTAIISTGDITDATPASFYAHQSERSLNEAIADDFLPGKSDILIGGGSYAFKSRRDGRNLFDSLIACGYTVAETIQAMDTIRNKRFIVLDNHAAASQQQGRGDFLCKSIRKCLSTFTEDSQPFFILAEGAQIDWGGHHNDMEYVVREVLDFDKAVGEAMKFVDANKETLLIVTADHETGGLSLLDGDISKGYIHGHFSTNDHTAVMVPVFSYGPGAELFRGVYQNTEINAKIKILLKL